MSDAPVSFELLNAYVDGELGAAEAARVARAVADDPDLARQVAALSRLRSAVVEGLEAPALSLPPRPAPRARGLALAASVALAVFIAGTAWMSALDRPAPLWLAEAWRAHGDWRPGGEAPVPAAPGLLPAGLAEGLPGAYLPDLSASRLVMVHLSARRLGGGAPALLAGYRGTRGCRISLVMFPAQGLLPEALRAFRRGQAEAYGWRAGPLDYLLLSDGMDARRFRLLADSVRKASRRHAPFDARTRMALRSSRDSSAPCAA